MRSKIGIGLALLLVVGSVQQAFAQEEPQLGYAAYTDREGRGEDYWTGAMDAAREKVLALERELKRLDNAEAALQNEFYGKDDPYQREQTKAAWDDTLDRRATMRAELENAKQELLDLEQEARRSGALPGWLRETRDQRTARKAFEEEPDQTSPTHQVDLEQLEREAEEADKAIYGEEEEEEEEEEE